MAMNSLQKAMVNANLAKEPKEKPKRHKKFTCKKCGATMTQPDWSNIMFCQECGKSFFVFSNHK